MWDWIIKQVIIEVRLNDIVEVRLNDIVKAWLNDIIEVRLNGMYYTRGWRIQARLDIIPVSEGRLFATIRF